MSGDVIVLARCPVHGLRTFDGKYCCKRLDCGVCVLEVEQVPMVPAADYDKLKALYDAVLAGAQTMARTDKP